MVVAVGLISVSAGFIYSIISMLFVKYAFLVYIGCPTIDLAGVHRVVARLVSDVTGVAAVFLQNFQLIISFLGISTSPLDGLISLLSASSTSLVGLSSPTIVLTRIIGVFAAPWPRHRMVYL